MHKSSCETIGIAYPTIMCRIGEHGLMPKDNVMKLYHELFNLGKTFDDFLTETVIPAESL